MSQGEKKIMESEGLNTLNFKELRKAFEETAKKHGASIRQGFGNRWVNLEDGLPWFEVDFDDRKLSAAAGKAFAKDLAEAMNIRIIFNRVEGDDEGWTAMGVMDVNPEALGASPVPPLSADNAWAEFMLDYGKEILPQTAMRPKKTKPRM